MNLPENPRLLWLGLSIALAGWGVARWDQELQRAQDEQVIASRVSDSLAEIERSSESVQRALDSLNARFTRRSDKLGATPSTLDFEALVAVTRRDSSLLASVATLSRYPPERAYLESRLRIFGAEARFWRACNATGENCLWHELGDLTIEISAALAASEVYQRQRDADVAALRGRRDVHTARIKGILRARWAAGALALLAGLSAVLAGLSVIISAHRRPGERAAKPRHAASVPAATGRPLGGRGGA